MASPLKSAIDNAQANVRKIVAVSLNSASKTVTEVTTSPLMKDLTVFFNKLTGYEKVELLRVEAARRKSDLDQTQSKNERHMKELQEVESERDVHEGRFSNLVMERNRLESPRGVMRDAASARLAEIMAELSEAQAKDSELRIKENRCKVELQQSTKELSENVGHYARAILSQHHEEQEFSNNTRRLSLYVTSGAILANAVFFFFSQSKISRQIDRKFSEWKLPAAVLAHPTALPPPPPPKEERANEVERAYLADLIKITTEIKEVQVAEQKEKQERAFAAPVFREQPDVVYLLGNRDTERKLVVGATLVAAVCSAVLLLSQLSKS